MRLIDADAIPESATAISTDGRLFVEWLAIVIAPTVDAVEVVHGQWLDGYAVDHNGKKVYDSIDCSACAGIFKIESHSREYWKEKFMFCPFCGSLMDGGNDNA